MAPYEPTRKQVCRRKVVWFAVGLCLAGGVAVFAQSAAGQDSGRAKLSEDVDRQSKHLYDKAIDALSLVGTEVPDSGEELGRVETGQRFYAKIWDDDIPVMRALGVPVQAKLFDGEANVPRSGTVRAVSTGTIGVYLGDYETPAYLAFPGQPQALMLRDFDLDKTPGARTFTVAVRFLCKVAGKEAAAEEEMLNGIGEWRSVLISTLN